ncbi:MAG: helix-turn-helix transcriptional regulator [Pseudomonadota bacterium]
MSRRKPFKKLTENWTEERKKRVADKTIAMDQELDLAALREALGLSQTELAEMLDRSQGAISQLENRTDMTLSNLRRVIEGMGGQLKVSAEFPDRTISLGIGSAPPATR